MTRKLVLTNSAWLIADKAVRLGLGLVVWIWIARHFGPELFGVWNFAIAFAAIFGTATSLGMDGIVVRELLRDQSRTGELLGTATILRLSASLVAGLVCVATLLVARPGERLLLFLVTMNALVFVFQSSQTLDWYFQSVMKTRPAVLAVNAAFLVSTLFRLGLLLTNATLPWFAVSLVVEATLAALFLWFAYAREPNSRPRWRFDRTVAASLLRDCWPLLLSSFTVMLYMRLDQVMLASMAGPEQVGQFSAALRIAEVWYFIPMALTTAAFPMLVRKKEEGPAAYEHYVQRLYDLTAWLGIFVALVTLACASWAVPLLYGPAYTPAANVLTIQI